MKNDNGKNVVLNPLAYSMDEAAQVLGVSKPTLYKYVNRENFPSFKLGGRILVSSDGLREWVQKQVN